MTIKVHMDIPEDAAKDVQQLTHVLHLGSEADTVIAAVKLMKVIVENAAGRGSRVVVTRPRCRRVTSVDIDPLFAYQTAASG